MQSSLKRNIDPRIYTSYTLFHPCYQDIWAFAVDAPHISPKVWSSGVDRSIGNSYLHAHACLHASFHRKVPLEMLPPVGQGCWDEIYSSTSEPEPTAATSLTLIRECIYGCGWLVAHFCTPDSLFFFFGCVQEVKKLEWHPRSRTPFHICFSSFGVCLPMTSKGRPTWTCMAMIHLHFRWLSSHYSDKQKERKPQQQAKWAEKATGDSSRADCVW